MKRSTTVAQVLHERKRFESGQGGLLLLPIILIIIIFGCLGSCLDPGGQKTRAREQKQAQDALNSSLPLITFDVLDYDSDGTTWDSSSDPWARVQVTYSKNFGSPNEVCIAGVYTVDHYVKYHYGDTSNVFEVFEGKMHEKSPGMRGCETFYRKDEPRIIEINGGDLNAISANITQMCIFVASVGENSVRMDHWQNTVWKMRPDISCPR